LLSLNIERSNFFLWQNKLYSNAKIRVQTNWIRIERFSIYVLKVKYIIFLFLIVLVKYIILIYIGISEIKSKLKAKLLILTGALWNDQFNHMLTSLLHSWENVKHHDSHNKFLTQNTIPIKKSLSNISSNMLSTNLKQIKNNNKT